MYDIHRMHRLFQFASDLSLVILGDDLGEPNAAWNRELWDFRGKIGSMRLGGYIVQYDVDRYLGI